MQDVSIKGVIMGLSAIPRRSVLVLIGVLALFVSTVWVASSRADAAFEASATPVVYIVTGENFPDALGVGPASALNRGPILFVTKNSIPTPTKNELTRLNPDRIVVVGGTAVISSSVEFQLTAWAPVQRLAGADRYETAALVSQAAFPAPPFGSGPTAAGAGERFASGANPILIYDNTTTELGFLDVTIPANGGVLEITASVLFENPDTNAGDGAWADAWISLDRTCESEEGLAGGTVDLVNSWFGNVPLNTGIWVGAGVHRLRICAWAIHDFASDKTLVDAARLSAVWSPTGMGTAIYPNASIAAASVSDVKAKLKAKRQEG